MNKKNLRIIKHVGDNSCGYSVQIKKSFFGLFPKWELAERPRNDLGLIYVHQKIEEAIRTLDWYAHGCPQEIPKHDFLVVTDYDNEPS